MYIILTLKMVSHSRSCKFDSNLSRCEEHFFLYLTRLKITQEILVWSVRTRPRAAISGIILVPIGPGTQRTAVGNDFQNKTRRVLCGCCAVVGRFKKRCQATCNQGNERTSVEKKVPAHAPRAAILQRYFSYGYF